MIRHCIFVPVLAGIAIAAAGCGRDIPQERHSYVREATAVEIAALRERQDPLNRSQRQRLEQGEQTEIRRALRFAELVSSSDTAFAGVGFVPGGEMGYAIARDGAGGLFPSTQATLPLEAIATRLDRVIAAGPRGHTLVGVTNAGTLMAWNTENTSQQVVLRPQQSTFSQIRTFDVQALSGTHRIATAVEGGRLEIWDLRSGDRVDMTRLTDEQPRLIARGSRPGQVIFGTNTGEVRVWRGGSGFGLLFATNGPILDLEIDPTGRFVLAAAKDGTVHLRRCCTSGAQQVAAFPFAAREVLFSPDGSQALALPARGAPLLIDTATGEALRLAVATRLRGHDPQFLGAHGGFAMRLGTNGLGIWTLPDRLAPAQFLPRSAPGHGVVAHAISVKHDLVILGTGSNRVEYWSLSRRVYLSDAVHSDAGISEIHVDPSGKRVMVAFADRRVIAFDIDPAQSSPIRIQSNAR
ncbi:WD40 repeat domain-containing protein [Roseinatronobacter monicus]|uniref:WD40 repeat protein n=1 Tax=Roseinatronobacter monicus TaxID=393481 RepID=A0A543K4G5_9RHOB|nr:WD40 repeat domain-containing protein [Roseinatronobacter monicus]TQM89963.1 hypothetical protein BD293_4282 [Roseinatronobacter monicus]